MSEVNFKTIVLKQRMGIDDLEGNLPEGGATDWWSSSDWEEHYRTLPEKIERNKKYIEELKANGEFGKETEVSISFVHHSMFDDVSYPTIFSSKCFLLDLKSDNGQQQ
jgi:hypothetical protein